MTLRFDGQQAHSDGYVQYEPKLSHLCTLGKGMGLVLVEPSGSGNATNLSAEKQNSFIEQICLSRLHEGSTRQSRSEDISIIRITSELPI